MKLENSEKSYNECEYSLNDDFFISNMLLHAFGW